ncbi:MAG: FAD-binding protein [Firmicutes bacterium]|nr:FAD-binding protein [Bacillota bacterium]
MAAGPVVVLGTGGAGLRAVLELRRAGVDAVAISKGAPGASGATPSALFSYCCARPGDPSNPTDLFCEDLMRSGVFVNDPGMVALLARDGWARLQDLREWGMPWTHDPGGEIARAWLPGHSVPRAFFVDRRTGKALSQVLLRACLGADVKLEQYRVALDLVVEDGRVTGVAVLDLLSGEAELWPCQAVIVATGGAAGLYRLNTNPPGQTGDGMGLLLRAGGELVDMEFMQMYPTVLVHPPAARGMEIPTGRLMAQGARLLNRHGEEFFSRWEEGPVGKATRDVLARTIAREIAAGRGTDAGGVYLDARHVSAEMEHDRYVRFLKDLGVDPTSQILQVAPGAHFSLGGVRVKPASACRAPAGVFAAGEVVGGVHGANRLAGNALTETQVFGCLAGREAIRYLHESPPRRKDSVSARPLERGESPLWDAICDARGRSGPGPRVHELEENLRDLMQRDAGVVRSREGLERALALVGEMRRAFYHRLVLPSRGGRWHPELLQAVETANLLDVAGALLASALARTESRGAHFRKDHPDRDPGWDGHNLVVRGVGEQQVVFRHQRASEDRRQVWP